MTTTVINTYELDVPQNLTGVGDDLLVTQAGSLVEDNGSPGVDSTGNSESITIDGLVYSASGGLATAVSITGLDTALFVNGQVEGDTGVDVASGGAVQISVGSQGSIASVDLAGTAVLFQGSGSSTVDTLNNAGDISGQVEVEHGGNDVINNTGTISVRVPSPGSYAVN